MESTRTARDIPEVSSMTVHNDVVLRGEVTGDGPTVLLLHAGGESRTVFRPVASALAAEGYRSVVFDQRGHGESGGDRTSIAPFITDVSAMLAKIDTTCVAVGASLGGMALAGALGEHGVRQRVSGLVLVDVIPSPQERTARAFLRRSGLLDVPNPLVDDILCRGKEFDASLRLFGGPVLLVRAADSPLTDSDVSRFVSTRPTASVVEVPTGHLVARQAPILLASIISDALRHWGHGATDMFNPETRGE